jgi:hypothetical protein
MGESISIHKNDTKMWSITKEYQNEEFPDDASSLGYEIKVYQETINKTFSEYLVNFEYLIRIIKNYGFVLLERDDARSLGLPESMGNFDQLFYEMQSQIKNRRLRSSDIQSALEMTPDEKKISFLNKYFIFKKVREVNAEEVSRVLTGSSVAQIELEKKETIIVDKPLIKKKPIVKKKKSKLKIGIAKPKQNVEMVVEEAVVAPAPGKPKPVIKVKKRKGKVKVKSKIVSKSKKIIRGKRKAKIKKSDGDEE